MPYTAKQCAYFGANPEKAPSGWKKHCTKPEQKKAKKKVKARGR